jgi:hypothetical protein
MPEEGHESRVTRWEQGDTSIIIDYQLLIFVNLCHMFRIVEEGGDEVNFLVDRDLRGYWHGFSCG